MGEHRKGGGAGVKEEEEKKNKKQKNFINNPISDRNKKVLFVLQNDPFG